MAIIERHIQTLHTSDIDVYKTWEKGFEAADIKAGGFPRKRHFQVVSGRDAQGVLPVDQHGTEDQTHGRCWWRPRHTDRRWGQTHDPPPENRPDRTR